MSKSAKLLRGSQGHNQALQYLNPKLSGPKEIKEQNQPIKHKPETNCKDCPLLVGLSENYNKNHNVTSFFCTQ